MTTTDIKEFASFILAQNTYLSKGFAPAFLEDGKVLYRDGSDFTNVSIQDGLGNYFYLRYDGDMTFPVERGMKASDCGAGRVGFLDSVPMVMVVVMTDADPTLLLNNMRNTALSYSSLAVLPTSAQLVREVVVFDEMRGASEEEITDALARLDRQTIIKIKMTVAKSFIANACIVDPCICT
jgi:hypothetical protein